MEKLDILSMLPQEIEAFLLQEGYEKYRALQVFEWLHKRGAAGFCEMENLPKALRAFLDSRFFISKIVAREKYESKNDGTVKFLNEFYGGILAESVLMRYKHGNTICISTQAGCKMGCVFCATGASGFQRDLTAGEYCAQVYNAGGVNSVVLMGCGEPLDNYGATLRFIDLITHPKGFGLGQRHITLSTCGIVPEIYKLAEDKPQITLAISLHAPDDELRQSLMPVAEKYPIADLLQACRDHVKITRRRITFEYALIKGVNDSKAHATDLAKLLKNLHCHVNLIPLNHVSRDYPPAPRPAAQAFANTLAQYNINATIRRTLGGDINAACGQLRSKGVVKP